MYMLIYTILMSFIGCRDCKNDKNACRERKVVSQRYKLTETKREKNCKSVSPKMSITNFSHRL
uniref:Reticulon-like protein n=1 Tax=Rhizophora mucronata TaxID=61149 RepID=A0A2P2JIP9_RHIMU